MAVASRICFNVNWNSLKSAAVRCVYATVGVLYAVYVSYACFYDLRSEGNIRLLWITCAAVFYFVYSSLKQLIPGRSLNKRIRKLKDAWFHGKYRRTLEWWMNGAVLLASLGLLLIFAGENIINNARSLSGIVLFNLILLLFSKHPTQIKWRTVIWGESLQLLFAVVVLRTHWGYAAFEWLGGLVTSFLSNAENAAVFVFGDDYKDHFIFMKISAIVVFFATTVSILYHLGVIQFIIRKLAGGMQMTMGTTAAESLNAAASILLGIVESPLLIRPLIPDMTRSEIFALMTTSMATIAGTTLGAYVMLGIPANHLMSASVMSAPASLALAKLAYPETERSKTSARDVSKMAASGHRNLLEAAAAGASGATSLVAGIFSTLIAFISILHFMNATLAWFGERVGLGPPEYPALSLQMVFSYVLWPVAYAMGADTADCRKLAELIGLKTFLNEFVSYTAFSKLMKNRRALNMYNGTTVARGDDLFLVDLNSTLVGGVLTERSELIGTYALCGFSNFGSVGIMCAVMTALAPGQRSTVADLALPAMLCGNLTCFLTACVAGILYQPGNYL